MKIEDIEKILKPEYANSEYTWHQIKSAIESIDSKKEKNKIKYLKRILGLPFFLMLNIIGIAFHLFKISKLFILYGGEAMAYDKNTTPKMIADIYFKLEKRHLKNERSN